MIALQNLVQTSLAKSLGWTLFHSLWEGVAVSLILLLVLTVARSPRVRYACACFAILAIVVGFIVTFAMLAPQKTGAAIRGILALPPAPSADAGSLSRSTAGFGPEDVLPWLVPFWLTGVALLQLRSIVGWFIARRLRSRGVCAAPDEWQRRLAQLRDRMRIAKPVMLLESCFTGVPVVIGYLRPVILVPIGMLTGMSGSAIEAILLHELAHVRRRDYLVNMLQMVAECFLFYHPAIWWISGVIRSERENCCDDLAVVVSGNAREYAAALAVLEQNRWANHEATLAATGGDLMKRIRRLLYPRENARVALAPALTAGVLTMGALFAITGLRAQTSPSPAVQVSNERLANAWRKWLTEDVVYIITDTERKAFQSLMTDAEREAFVTQFWLRRDPTPDTVRNEFQEEHYRRIAYANTRWSTSALAGWKTDRGRIYITYGPPDEIDSHPSGGSYQRPEADGGGTTSTYPFEDWRYRFIEGIGKDINIEFVDTALNGEYHMTMDPSEKDALPKVDGPPPPANNRFDKLVAPPTKP